MNIVFPLPYLNYLSPVHVHQPLLSVVSRLLRKNNIAVAPDLLEDKLYTPPLKEIIEYNEKNLQHWLGAAGVHATPTFFVNGFMLPESYSLSDIRYLIARVE